MKKFRSLFQMVKSRVTFTSRLGILAAVAVVLLAIATEVVFDLFAIAGVVLAQKETKNSEDNWTDTFPVENFSSTGINPYFILKPGYFLVLEGTTGGKKIQLTITVLNETKTVDGVETRVVEEREKNVWEDKLIEVSRNYFAIGKRTNSVYYFGEDVEVYKDGQVVSTDGSWQAGIKGAKFGAAMPGIVLLGSRYYQEIAPGTAMDRAENVSLSEGVETPAGVFKNCLKVRESTPLEPASKEFKMYAPGIGLAQDNELKLVKYGNRK